MMELSPEILFEKKRESYPHNNRRSLIDVQLLNRTQILRCKN